MADGTIPVRFPENFRWGAATSAYQIEGAVTEGGRGESIWDRFCRVPGAIHGGDDGTVACDHYHRYRDDVTLLKELGIGSYRFSVAWPRIQPAGTGSPLEAGLDFYDRLTDELLAAGIDPVATLYHWDLPQALEDRGGWTNRDTAAAFAEYAAIVFARLGDRIETWGTVNEPWCSAFLGYCDGQHAPGRTEPAASVAALHHLLLGHGLAVRAMRAAAPPGWQHRLGASLNLSQVRGERDGDVEAVRKVDGAHNRITLDPLLLGHYPPDVVADLRPVTDFSFVADGDEVVIAEPLDWLGVNYYSSTRVRVAGTASAASGKAGLHDAARSPFPGLHDVELLPAMDPVTGMGWEQDPASFTAFLRRVSSDYPSVPLLITENGAAFPDTVREAGTVDDQDRLRYLDEHVRAVHDAIRAGVPVVGYLTWSLLDNFEWAYGYSQRFGIVHVDFATQARTIKASGRWFSGLAATGTLPGEIEEKEVG